MFSDRKMEVEENEKESQTQYCKGFFGEYFLWTCNKSRKKLEKFEINSEWAARNKTQRVNNSSLWVNLSVPRHNEMCVTETSKQRISTLKYSKIKDFWTDGFRNSPSMSVWCGVEQVNSELGSRWDSQWSNTVLVPFSSLDSNFPLTLDVYVSFSLVYYSLEITPEIKSLSKFHYHNALST